MPEDKPTRPPIESQFDTTKRTGAEKWEQKRRLASAMRMVIERLVPSDAPEDELRTAADALERYAEQLKKHPRLTRVLGHAARSRQLPHVRRIEEGIVG